MAHRPYDKKEQTIIHSQTLKAGKRTYFFDVKETAAGEYYMSITESKRLFDKEEGNFYYKKRSLFLYKESMHAFLENFESALQFIEENQGFEMQNNELTDKDKHEF